MYLHTQLHFHFIPELLDECRCLAGAPGLCLCGSPDIEHFPRAEPRTCAVLMLEQSAKNEYL